MAASESAHLDPQHAGHVHMHVHGAGVPHPAQTPGWSLLRLTVKARLVAALLASAGLWAVVLTAMR